VRADGGLMAVVKANAYGLSLPVVAQSLQDMVDCWAVANPAEALALEQALPHDTKAIFLLSPLAASHRLTALRTLSPRWIVTVSSLAEAQDFSALAATHLMQPLRIAIMVDIGMGRSGIVLDDLERAAQEIASIWALPHLEVASVIGHFPSADEDADATAIHEARYLTLARLLEQRGLHPRSWQTSNSAGALSLSRQLPRELVRCGIALYGACPLADRAAEIRPVLSWRAQVVQVRFLPEGWGVSYGSTYQCPSPRRVATLSVGYADGLSRHLVGQGAFVLINGHRCPLLGRVTMDHIMVDVTEVPAHSAVEPGAVATLIGRDGPDQITVEDMARWSGTIPYEVFCRLGPRVERV
jgi:alanine racemase